MPTDEVRYLRLLLAEPNGPTGNAPSATDGPTGSLFSDDQLQLLVDMAATLNRAVEIGWNAKAAFLQTLVDVEESGVNRKLSQMFKNAQSMAQQAKIVADEEWAAIISSMRVVGQAASPWGPQRLLPGSNSVFGSYIIGDISNASYGGGIFFIEVPVDPNALTEHLQSENDLQELPPTPLDSFIVPTERRTSLTLEVGRSYHIYFNYIDPDTRAVVDLTGASGSITVRNAPGGTVLQEVDLVTDVDNNRFILQIDPGVTGGWDFIQGDYEATAGGGPLGSVSLMSGTIFVVTGDD